MAKYKTTLNGLRKMLTSVNNKMQQQRKQTQGETFDLDVLTDLYADIHSKITPDERVYLSQRKKKTKTLLFWFCLTSAFQAMDTQPETV